eukprot:5647734-Ditylum_brightwellii.AAC.1
MCKILFQRVASCAMAECINPTKQVSEHLLVIHGAKSWAEVSEEDKLASTGIKPNNDAAESAFAVYSDSFKKGQTIRQDHAVGKGRKSNEEDDQEHDIHVSGT